MERTCFDKSRCDDIYMSEFDEDEGKEENDIYKKLAEKDYKIMSAVEVGNLLMEENHELKRYFEMLREEYLQRVEVLEQDRHNLQRELNIRGILYESQMQELQEDICNLRGQMDDANKSSETQQFNVKSACQELSQQNNYLTCELEKVKSSNHELNHKLKLLADRFEQKVDGRFQEPAHTKRRSESNSTVDSNIPSLKAEVQTLSKLVIYLNEDSEHLKESLKNLVSDDKVSNMEDASNLKHQMSVCQGVLKVARRKNKRVHDELKKCLLIQSPEDEVFTSQDEEVGFSDPEVDMNISLMCDEVVEHDKYEAVNMYEDEDVDIDTGLKENIKDIYHKLSGVQYKVSNTAKNAHPELPHVLNKLMRHLVDLTDLVEEREVTALKERDHALRKETEVTAKYQEAQNELNELNNQLIASVRQKYELSKQVEEWQADMDVVIRKGLRTQRSQKGQNTFASSLYKPFL